MGVAASRDSRKPECSLSSVELKAMEPPPTLEELVRKVRISPKLLDQKCSDEHIKSISLFLGWRRVAPHLGLSKMDIEAIEFEKRTEGERRLEVLQKWKMKYGFKATFNSLIAVLLAIENADDAERVCALLHTPADAGKHSALTAAATTPTTPGDHQQSSPVTATEANLRSIVAEPSNVQLQTSETDIDREIQELERQFLKVVGEARKDLTTVELSEIKLCVTQLPVSVKYQHLHLLEHNLSAIVDAKSVDAIFAVLGRYWNYLNCELLNEVVHQLGSDATKQLMEQYMEKLQQFQMNTKLGDIIGKASHNIPPHFTTFVTEMGDEWRKRTLEDLQNFRKKVAYFMQLKEYALHFNSVETGSIAVTWAFHSSLPEIADILQATFEMIEKYSVLRIFFRGKSISRQRALESPPSTTPPAPLPLPTPPESSALQTDAFDVIAALLIAGVPHIVVQILQILDEKSLSMSEQVSNIWKDIIADLCMWKRLIQHKIDNNPLWRNLFKRRGWSKYLDVFPAEHISRQFYRQLHHSACRDIHSLEANWRRGHYTVTRVDTGSEIMCLQCDVNKIVTGHSDRTIKIWDRSTLQVPKVLNRHKKAVCCLQYDEKVVIFGSYDHTVKVWDIQTGQVMNNLLHHKERVSSLKFRMDTLVTGSDDRTVAVWKIVSPTDITLRMALKGHEGDVLAVDLSETTLISGSEDNTIKMWDAFSGELVRTLCGHSHWVWCLQLQGSHLISGSSEAIRIWNVDTGECVRELRGHGHDVWCVAVNNKRIVSGSLDSTILVWDLAAALDTGSSSDTLCIATLKGHTNWVRAVQCDDFQIVSGSDGGALVIHDFLDPTPPILRT